MQRVHRISSRQARPLSGWLLVFTLLGPTATVAAQPCFAAPARRGRAAQVVGLESSFRVSARCEYARRSAGPYMPLTELAGQEADFITVYRQLAEATRAERGAMPLGDPRVLFGRPRAGGDTQTLMLKYCSHYLLEEQLGFRVVSRAGGGDVRVERVAGAPGSPGAGDCGAAALELRAYEGPSDERLRGGPPAHVLETGRRALSLPHGDWGLYAARPGSEVGIRVGVFRSQRVVTPLVRHLRDVGLAGPARSEPARSGRTPGDRPLLSARFPSGGRGLSMVATPYAQSQALLVAELRTASDAGLVSLTRTDRGERPVVVTPLVVEAGDAPEQPVGVRVPDSLVVDYLQQTYGDASRSLTPSLADWTRIMSKLALCLAPSYQPSSGALAGPLVAGQPADDSAVCAAMSGLVSFRQVSESGAGGEARLCHWGGMQVLSHRGARRQPRARPFCAGLSSPRLAARIAMVGDRVSLEGEGLCVLIDNEKLTPQDGQYRLERHGLLEVRQGGGPTCQAQQALSRLRMWVVDPERQWLPVGLHPESGEASACSDPSGEGPCPWETLSHDESGTFAFIRRDHDLRFLWSGSPIAAAALNADPERSVQIGASVPLLSRVEGGFSGVKAPALIVHAQRSDLCPQEGGHTFESLTREAGAQPEALPPDASFHVFLLGVSEPSRPVQCLARARFRVRPRRAFAETVGDALTFELGVLGDVRAALFFSEPVAAGFVLPVAWFRVMFPFRFVGFELAGNAVAAGAFDPPEVSRVGVAISAAFEFGVPDWLPRLLSVGVMLHGAAQTHAAPRDNPLFSAYLGLNLASLIDLAGGR